MNTKLPKLTSRKCHKCGKSVLLSEQHTEKVDGQYGLITVSTYICSDEECQKETNRDIAKMKKQKIEKDLAAQKRLERINTSRKLAKEKKLQDAARDNKVS